VDTLASIGQPLHDDEFTSFILNGLDKEYDSCFEAVNHRDNPMTPRDLYSRLLNTEQCITSRRSFEGYHEVYKNNSLANAASCGGGKTQNRPAPSPALEGASHQRHLRHPRAVVPAPAALPAAPSCLASFVDLMAILLHGAIAASNRTFLALVTMVKETSVKFLWQLL
jgi:hypothetical protein